MTDTSEGAIFDEAERYIVTGELDPVASADESLLNDDQRRRVEALFEARDLLVTDAPSTGMFTASSHREHLLLEPSSSFCTALITLADYILGPDADQSAAEFYEQNSTNPSEQEGEN